MYEGKPTLKVLLGEYPKTKALANIEFAPIPEAQKGFKALVRENAFDIAEVAIVTHLVAQEFGKPYVLLPYVMNGKFHHGSLQYNSARGPLKASDLNGKKIGLRSYTQTTPTWVRGYLSDDFGVNLDTVTFVTFEDAHVKEYVEPPNVVRAPEGKKLVQMLKDGEIDAMLSSAVDEDPNIKPILENPKAEQRAWYDKHHAVPINHMIVVRKDLAEERPDIVREYWSLLEKARDMSGGAKIEDGINLQPTGLDNVRVSIAKAVDYALNQKLIRKKVSVDDLFTPFTASLGA
jgi:4,5-dihydroxyphthalate decarboxylase